MRCSRKHTDIFSHTSKCRRRRLGNEHSFSVYRCRSTRRYVLRFVLRKNVSERQGLWRRRSARSVRRELRRVTSSSSASIITDLLDSPPSSATFNGFRRLPLPRRRICTSRVFSVAAVILNLSWTSDIGGTRGR
ncbi:hypothetical protein PUN28_013748 [Cardiocondyla obscurior]|uniref:Uncharacterized protein n=1 Tax=Cardiocondyla obscurior TaxID=286306 RepID=A0AAW2F322_9HYME